MRGIPRRSQKLRMRTTTKRGISTGTAGADPAPAVRCTSTSRYPWLLLLIGGILVLGSLNGCQLFPDRVNSGVAPPELYEVAVADTDTTETTETSGIDPNQLFLIRDSLIQEQAISEDSVKVLEIATLLPVGGPPALAEFAEEIAEGVEVAAAIMQDDAIEVRITSVDDQGDLALTRELVRELENTSIGGIVGFLEDISLEIASEARESGIPLVSPTARSASQAGSGAYSLEGPDPIAAEAIARYAQEYGYTRIAIIHSQGSGSIAEADVFSEISEALGLPIVGRYSYEVGATFFGEEILAAEDALRADEIAALGLEEDDTLQVEMLEPVALFLPVPPEDIEFVAPQVLHYGLDTLGIDILGTSGWTDSQILQKVNLRHTSGVVATAALGSAEDGLALRRFREAYEEHFERSLISAIPALGYDAALVLIEGLRRGANSPEGVLKTIESLTEIEGARGIYSVVDGKILRHIEVVYIDDGMLLPIR